MGESEQKHARAQSDRRDPPVVASQAMLQVFATLDRVAHSVVPVLILGETGTGKEVVARTIHLNGPRAKAPFKCVNCGGLPETLVEATLFGHEKGSFTGAADQKVGVFEAAHGGTVFLDEIGELPPSAQAALLRVLETKRITRLGSVDETPVDVRILAATHRDLEAMCTRGEFRWDLYYRLNVFMVRLPPLRERPEDIVPLSERFMKDAAEQNSRSLEHITHGALSLLRAHNWPGNVRELKNVIDRAVVMSSGPRLDVEHLPDALRSPPAGGATTFASAKVFAKPTEPTWLEQDRIMPVAPSVQNADLAEDDDCCSTVDLEVNHELDELDPSEGPFSDAGFPAFEEVSEGTEDLGQQGPLLDFKTQMHHAERRVLLQALEMSNMNQTEAARLLQMPLRTLVHKIKSLGLRDEINRLKAAQKRSA